ncbi:glycosyl transferase family 2 [Microbacterium laevaniformans OR221]|nr:glycosyl transferase family 2 [Microbacterium laevaniformans OR221]
MPARVSIVIRTKDRPEFLARALGDVAGQTFEDCEVIVVNDGGVRAQVDRVVSDFRNVTVIDTEAPGGRCAAANAGVRWASGEFLALHDDDDLWEPSFLSRTVEWLDAHPADAGVGVATAIVYETLSEGRWRESSRVPFWEGLTQISLTDMLEINRAVPISLLYRRAVHDEVGGYDETLAAVEDWEFFLRILSLHPIGFIPGEPLALWTQRPRAHGADANSMFALQQQHVVDDAQVRDRALRDWAVDNGLGLPLYIAAVERRLAAHIDESVGRLRDQVRADIDAHQPIMSRLRRLRRHLRR